MFESQALAFMDRDRPSCFQRILAKSTGNRLCYFFGVRIDRIFDIRPGFSFYLYFIAVFSDNRYFVRVDKNDFTDFTVVVPVFAGRVIFDEHNLGSVFQFQLIIGWIRVFREVVVYFGIEGV